MKRTFFKIAGKRIIAVAFLSTAVVMTASAENKAKITSSNIELISPESRAEISFAGNEDDVLLFDVKIENENSDKFTVTIKDENGEVIFEQNYNDKNFNKRFKMLNGSAYGNLYFSITSWNKELEGTFAVSTSHKTVDEVNITKL